MASKPTRLRQTATVEGADIVLRWIGIDGTVLSTKVWAGAARYIRLIGAHGFHTIIVPKDASIDFE